MIESSIRASVDTVPAGTVSTFSMLEGEDLTEGLLSRLAQGDGEASSALLARLYSELRKIAERCMQAERADHTLQPTALVHEAYVRLFEGRTPQLADRAHFLRLAARAMRNVLVDHARSKRARKRDAGAPLEGLDLTLAAFEQDGHELLDLESALERLENMDEELGRVVELHIFGGLTMREVAEVEGCSLSTLERRWRVARGWLQDCLEG